MRSFISIELPEKVRSDLSEVEKRLKKTKADFRWVKPDNIHLTLKFLGEIKEESIGEIINVMRRACSHCNSFNLELEGVGLFPNLKYPRVLWVGIKDNPLLTDLQTKIEDGMVSLGFKKDNKKFKAHLTLGRFRSSTGKEDLMEAIEPHKKNSFGLTNVKYISLMKSDLSPFGARYTTVSEVPLKIPGDD